MQLIPLISLVAADLPVVVHADTNIHLWFKYQLCTEQSSTGIESWILCLNHHHHHRFNVRVSMLSTGWTVHPKIWEFLKPIFYGPMPFLAHTSHLFLNQWVFFYNLTELIIIKILLLNPCRTRTTASLIGSNTVTMRDQNNRKSRSVLISASEWLTSIVRVSTRWSSIGGSILSTCRQMWVGLLSKTVGSGNESVWRSLLWYWFSTRLNLY